MNVQKILVLPDGDTLEADKILYVSMDRNYAEIHIAGGRVLETRMTMTQMEAALGQEFVRIHRGTLVSVRAIHDVTDTVNLNNGEQLNYASRKRSEILALIQQRQKELLRGLPGGSAPTTRESYQEHYRAFDSLPFAFTDIEMVFDEQRSAVDWIFRYGNPALAELEKLPLETLIGASFSSLFANMDAKWLRSYERSAMYGETLEIIDYSPEIDTYLKVISFPTFPGHCGCILFNIENIRFANSCSQPEQPLIRYLGKMAQA